MGEASAPGGPEPCDAPSQTLYVNNLAERPRKDGACPVAASAGARGQPV